MKSKLKLKAAAGVQSRQVGNAFCLYEGSRPYRYRKLGKKIVILPPAPAPDFKHPWKTSVRFYKKGEGLMDYQGNEIEGFGAYVQPGLVNGLDPVCIGAWGGGKSNLANVPSQGVFSKAPGLLDSPIIPLPSMAFNLVEKPMAEGLPHVSIPLGLKKLGVIERASSISSTGDSAGGTFAFNLNTAVDPKSVKYAAITWFYLRTARPSVLAKGDIDMSNAIFDGVKYNSKYSMENLSKWGNRSQFMAGPPPSNPVKTPGLIASPPTDLGFDFFPIAEIWLISGQTPVEDDRGNPIIDGGWIPFVRHRCFWNLEYRFDASHIGEEDKMQMKNAALPFLGLIGRYTVAPIMAGAAMASMANEITASSIQGIMGNYWT